MDITERLREFCVCDDGYPEQCVECAGAEEITTLRADNEAKDAEMKRMAVENEAWRSGRLMVSFFGEPSWEVDRLFFVFSVSPRLGIPMDADESFETITAAVDALMAEREE